MNYITVIMAVFSLIAAIDRIFGNRLGLGREFEKGFMLLGTMALSMIGMISFAPVIAEVLAPCFDFVYNTFKIDPSIIPASLFANDMGGAPLAKEVCKDMEIGMFNALVVSSMMGCTFSFNIPFALGIVKKDKHSELMLGLLCGLVTIPIGCFISGIILALPLGALLINLLPLIIFSLILAAGLIFIPDICVKIFSVFGFLIKAVITVGLALGILKALVGIEIIKGLADIKEGAEICFNASIVMSGAFPLIFALSKLLKKPLVKLGNLLHINETSALGLLSTLATNATTFQMVNDMDSKGAVLNSAFAVSAAFTFAGHLAFTLAFDASYLPYVIIAKLISGISALLFALIFYKKLSRALIKKPSLENPQ